MREAVMVFTVIDRKILEKSLEYLVCPNDKTTLSLFTDNVDLITEGEFKCNDCGSSYQIKDGVPYFYSNGFEWGNPTDEEIVKSISETVKYPKFSAEKIVALSELYLNDFDRKKSIDKIFRIVEKVVQQTGASETVAANLLQAATAARYELEIYRGTFLVPVSNKEILVGNNGIVVEGACASGECLEDLSKTVESDFCIGLDISGNMARKAQNNAGKNSLYIQGDIMSVPVKSNTVGTYVLNNVFDRVVNPARVSDEAKRIIQTGGNFLISNCDPLQYTYRTSDGNIIEFVPKENQMSLLEALKKTGCDCKQEVRGRWDIDTVAYGKEALPYVSYVGVKR